jgi:hypothetical protein
MWDTQKKNNLIQGLVTQARPLNGPRPLAARAGSRHGDPMSLKPPSLAPAGGGLPPSDESAAAAAATAAAAAAATVPAQVELVMSALEAGRHGGPAADYAGPNRRHARRRPLRVKATLRLFSDGPHTPAWTLFTRDVHSRGLGFITPHRLPLGYGGVLELPASCVGPAPEGEMLLIPCTLLRCREAAPGWFEGSVYFNREQPKLAEEGQG